MVDGRPERAPDPHLDLPARLRVLGWLAALVAALCGCDAGETGPDAAELERLRSLGYVDGELEHPEGAPGLLRHDPQRSQPGWNLVQSRSDHRALLLDMEGRVAHAWSTGAERDNWSHVEWLPDGDLVGIVRGERVTRIGPDGATHWSTPLAAHHDLAVTADGRIFALASAVLDIPHRGGTLPILDERIVRLGPDGSVEEEVSLHPLLAGRIPAARLDAIAAERAGPGGWWRRLRGPTRVGRESSDVYHANSLEILERDVPGVGRAGDALVSLRELDLVASVDLGARRLVWSWGPGVIEGQHDARLRADGRLLLFDNGARRGWSRVIEVDPRDGRILWEWSGEPPRSLRSPRKGGAQALPNGNVLVVEGDRGRAYEVTRSGEVVWEYQHSRPVYRLTRLPPGAFPRGESEYRNARPP